MATKAKPAAALATTRREFGAEESNAAIETARTALANQARAQVEARFVMAIRNPRDFDVARDRLLRECLRPSFAESALYSKPVGGGESVEGPSVRFVEAALRVLGNAGTEAATIYDDAEKRIVRVVAVDFESNVAHSKDVTVAKVVERKSLRPGQSAIGERTNSEGRTVFLVEANDDQLLNKEAALVSKAIRTCGLRLIPGDLVDEAVETVKATLHSKAKGDPDGERRKILDAFSSIGVRASEVKGYLGHDPASSSPAEISDLRALYNAIKNGETSWGEALEGKKGSATLASASLPAAPPPPAAPSDIVSPTCGPAAPPVASTDPLAAVRAAIAAAGTRRALLATMKSIAALPPDLQTEARDVYNARADELRETEGGEAHG